MNLGNVVFFGELIDKENDDYIIKHTKGSVPLSAINYNRKIYNGIISTNAADSLTLLCRSGIGAYPKYSDLRNVPEMSVGGQKTIKHNNLFGLRILSEKRQLMNKLKKIHVCDTIIVSGLHSPYLAAATKLKKKTNAKIIVIVNDLPQFMRLSKSSTVYKALKKIDMNTINKHLLQADGFVFITEAINKVINIKNLPYIVIEGIVDSINNNYPIISNKLFYTGTVSFQFDVVNLIDSFKIANEKMNNTLELHVLGDGDASDYIIQQSKINSSIKYHGLKTPEETQEFIKGANAFINPRTTTHEYTKYSYPSKNFDYLKTCKPLIGYKFPNINDSINELIFSPSGKEENLAASIIRAMSLTTEDLISYQESVIKVLKSYEFTNYVNSLINLKSIIKNSVKYSDTISSVK